MPVKALFYILHTASNKRFFVFFYLFASQRPDKTVRGYAEKHDRPVRRFRTIRFFGKKKRPIGRLERKISCRHAFFFILFPHELCNFLCPPAGKPPAPRKGNHLYAEITPLHPDTTTSRIKEDKVNGYGSLVEITTRPPVSKPGLGIVTSLSPE